jgi:hypothetical protein
MRYVKVNVMRDETTNMQILVGPWEVPILEAKHGESRLEVGEHVDYPDRPWPIDGASEMQRLGALYGKTSAADNSPTFAELAYGHGKLGIKAMDAAIATVREEAEAPAAKRGKGRPASKGADLVGAASA